NSHGLKQLAVPISINGSNTFNVLLDTGSVGLRVFAQALEGTSVTQTSREVSVAFGPGGKGFQFDGVEASGAVSLGTIVEPTSIAFHLVTSITCPVSDPNCFPASYTKYGIYGILGVGLRPAVEGPPDIYSPIAQLGAPLSSGFL